jgi:hypothetical protein
MIGIVPADMTTNCSLEHKSEISAFFWLFLCYCESFACVGRLRVTVVDSDSSLVFWHFVSGVLDLGDDELRASLALLF